MATSGNRSGGKKASKVRWGIISTANIGTAKVIPAMLKIGQIEVIAISSRNLRTARKWAGSLGIPKAYGSYEEMLDDPDIDAVYNPLPNHLHVPLTMAAAARGKHVLCEKPIAMNAAEAQTLKDAPKGVLIAEAFMVRHHPQWQKARELVREGRIGTPRAIQVQLCSYIDDPQNVRNMADIGGGALYDLGCYATLSARYIFGTEPTRVVSLVDRDSVFKTDRMASAMMDFGDSRHLTFTVGTLMAPYQGVNIAGTDGRIEIKVPITPPPDKAAEITFDSRKKKAGGSPNTIKLPEVDQYGLQAEAFSRAIRGEETLEFGVADAIRQMRVMDALFRSERSGAWEKP